MERATKAKSPNNNDLFLPSLSVSPSKLTVVKPQNIMHNEGWQRSVCTYGLRRQKRTRLGRRRNRGLFFVHCSARRGKCFQTRTGLEEHLLLACADRLSILIMHRRYRERGEKQARPRSSSCVFFESHTVHNSEYMGAEDTEQIRLRTREERKS